MRLKTYTAPTVQEAMAMVRLEMGDEAIIVSTGRAADGRGAEITAAIDAAGSETEPLFLGGEEEPGDVLAMVRQSLVHHGAPGGLAERLALAAATFGDADPSISLAGALESVFAFQPLRPGATDRPLMLVGPPGAGKTLTVAKLLAREVMAGRAVEAISIDIRRAGGVEQLAAFTRILSLDLATADSPHALAEALGRCRPEAAVVIDAPGCNPYSASDMAELGASARAVDAEPVLVMAAGGDPVEAADIALAFAEIGAHRMVATRLDMARRLGGLLAAAGGARLGFSEISLTPQVAGGLSSIDSLSLARLLLPERPAAAGAAPSRSAANRPPAVDRPASDRRPAARVSHANEAVP